MVAFKEEILTSCFFRRPRVTIAVVLIYGPLAQLARAPALQAGCHQFESGTVHHLTHENYNLAAASRVARWTFSARMHHKL